MKSLPYTEPKIRKKITGRKKVKNAASRLRQKSSCSTRSSCSQSLIRPPPLHVPGQRRRRAHGRSPHAPKASPATPCEGGAGFAGAAGRFAAPINGASFGQLQVDVLERRPAHLEAFDLLSAELVDQLVEPLRRL